MGEFDPRSMLLLFDDPYSETTKKNRRNLLAVSVSAILIEKLHIYPTSFPALGISNFPVGTEKAIPVILAIAVLLFHFAFLTHAFLDLLQRQELERVLEIERYTAINEVKVTLSRQTITDTAYREPSTENLSERERQRLTFLIKHFDRSASTVTFRVTNFFRGTLDHSIPLFIGFYAIYLTIPKLWIFGLM